MSLRTLNRSFFDDLWPLILEENICDTRSKNTSEFFVPEKRLDNLWAHDLLAKKCYKNYQKPKELKLAEDETDDIGKATSEPSIDDEGPVYRMPYIPNLREQCHCLTMQQQRMERLAFDFANRKFPWYMQESRPQTTLDITEELIAQFSNPFEMNMLKNLHMFQCSVMIIDVGSEVRLGEIKRWLKFCKYVKIVAVVRCEIMARRLKVVDGLQTVWLAENLENTWQEELSRSLLAVKTCANQLNILNDCAQPFMFVFAKNRYDSSWDTFKILKKI